MLHDSKMYIQLCMFVCVDFRRVTVSPILTSHVGLLQALQLCLPDLLTHYRQLEGLAVGEFPLDPVQELLCSVLQVTQKICNSVLATLSLSASSLLEEELGRFMQCKL